MKYVLGLLLVLFMACNTSSDKDAGYTEDNLPNPEKVEPPSEAIPGDMTIKNDSVVVPDSAALQRQRDSMANQNNPQKQ